MSTVRFIHISDSHIGPDDSFELHGINTATHSRAAVEEIKRLHRNGVPFDFLIHTGDVQNDGDDDSRSPGSGAQIAGIWEGSPVPLFVVNGNHDDAEDLGAITTESDQLLQRVAPELSPGVGHFAIGSQSFFILDARPPAHKQLDPQGQLPQWQLEALERSLSADDTQRLTLFTHYPPVALDCQWVDHNMLIENGDELHRLLVRYKNKIAGCFFGHVHQGIAAHRDGILYSSVGAISSQFSSWPTSETPTFDSRPLLYFNYVTVTGVTVIIKQHVVMV